MVMEFEELNKVLAQDNWEEEMLNRAITIKWSEDKDNKFFLLKYNQLASDFTDPVVRACRGVIYSANEKPFKCVCAPFLKFGNYGEEYCPDIDWNTARVLEKIDGSLMKLWYYNDEWHLSTNGTIDADEAEVNEKLTFKGLFDLALLDCVNKTFKEFCDNLDKAYVYMFELTAPENRVVIEYKERNIWFLARRNMATGKEDQINITGLKTPKTFYLNNLNDCIALATQMSQDQEGMVVNDANFNRIKIKSPEYLMACHLVNNRQITTKRIIQMIKDLSIDDFLAYCNEYGDQVNSVQEAMRNIATKFNAVWDEVKEYAVGADTDVNLRKIYAKKVSSYGKEKSFLFWKCDHKDLLAEDYLLGLSLNSLKRLIDNNLNKKS